MDNQADGCLHSTRYHFFLVGSSRGLCLVVYTGNDFTESLREDIKPVRVPFKVEIGVVNDLARMDKPQMYYW